MIVPNSLQFAQRLMEYWGRELSNTNGICWTGTIHAYMYNRGGGGGGGGCNSKQGVMARQYGTYLDGIGCLYSL